MTTEALSPAPGVTVAIACFNQGRFLEDAVRSVLAQTLPAAEIILVDDGSTDDTAARARRYPQVAYCRQDNAGLSAARNTGLRLASGDRILFLDADDALAPTTLQVASERFAEIGNPAFVYGGYAQVDFDRRRMSTHAATAYPDGFAGLLAGNHIAMHGTVLYDTRLLRAVGGFDPSLPSCEDYDVYLRLARRHPIGAYEAIGAEYRRHGATMSRQRLRMIETASQVINRHTHGRGLTVAHRDAARTGKAFMTSYYCGEISAELKAARRNGWLRVAVRDLLRAARTHPVAFGRLLAHLIAEPPRQRR